jgi:hypothetical protein
MPGKTRMVYVTSIPGYIREGMSDVISIPREGGVIRSRFRGSEKKFQASETEMGR